MKFTTCQFYLKKKKKMIFRHLIFPKIYSTFYFIFISFIISSTYYITLLFISPSHDVYTYWNLHQTLIIQKKLGNTIVLSGPTLLGLCHLSNTRFLNFLVFVFGKLYMIYMGAPNMDINLKGPWVDLNDLPAIASHHCMGY
jgi:hypothetical protein